MRIVLIVLLLSCCGCLSAVATGARVARGVVTKTKEVVKKDENGTVVRVKVTVRGDNVQVDVNINQE